MAVHVHVNTGSKKAGDSNVSKSQESVGGCGSGGSAAGTFCVCYCCAYMYAHPYVFAHVVCII